MGAWWWSWLLALAGCAALYLIGRKDRRGWMLGVAVQALWMTYAVVTHQFGFIVASLVYGATYAKGLLNWNKDAKAREVSPAQGTLHLIEVALRNPALTDQTRVQAIRNTIARHHHETTSTS